MRTLLPLVLFAAAACGSSSTNSPPKPEPAPAPAASKVPAPEPAAPKVPAPEPLPPSLAGADADAVIARLWPDGCFMFRDAAGALHASDRARCELARRPYSTFKIPNALLAIEAGLLDGPEAAMTWDKQAIPDDPGFLAAWRKPHTLRSGMAVSAVPYFRTLARQLGEDRMRTGLAKLDYGNRDMSGGLDLFWLSGGIRISAARQLAFVEDLARGKLAISARAQGVVRDVLVVAKTDAAVLRGKTGSGRVTDRAADERGWLLWQVGWIEVGAANPAIIPYACWMESRDEEINTARAAREQRLRAMLDALGLFPAPAPAAQR